MGRRGEGEGRRRAGPARGRGGALPGRQQRGAHGGRGEGEVRAPDHSLGDPPPRLPLRDRLRRRHQPGLAHRRDGGAGAAGRLPGRQPLHLQERAPHHALPPGTGPGGGVPGRQAPHRHHGQGRGAGLRGQGRARGHPHGGPPGRAALPGQARVQYPPEESALARDLRCRGVHGGGDPRAVPPLRRVAGALHHGHGTPALALDRRRRLRDVRGAQGTLLDVWTTGPTVHHLFEHDGGGACTGTGCRPQIHGALGISKAYCRAWAAARS